jgi:hypothetical protein
MSVLSNVELVMWSPAQDAEPPLVAQMRDQLQDHGFRRDRADEVPNSTAFRRAVKAKEDKGYKATIWQNGKLRAQLERLEPDANSNRLNRVWIGAWAMDDQGQVEGNGLDLPAHKQRYVWADVSGIIQAILKHDGLGAYTPRRAGGVYFVPVSNADLLDRLEACCRSIGLNLLRYQVPDTSAQRGEIAEAIAASLSADCDEHAESLASYSAESTKPGIVANRLQAIQRTKTLTERLGSHLGQRGIVILERIDQLTQQCRDFLTAAESYRPMTAGRRILTAALPGSLPGM